MPLRPSNRSELIAPRGRPIPGEFGMLVIPGAACDAPAARPERPVPLESRGRVARSRCCNSCHVDRRRPASRPASPMRSAWRRGGSTHLAKPARLHLVDEPAHAVLLREGSRRAAVALPRSPSSGASSPARSRLGRACSPRASARTDHRHADHRRAPRLHAAGQRPDRRDVDRELLDPNQPAAAASDRE